MMMPRYTLLIRGAIIIVRITRRQPCPNYWMQQHPTAYRCFSQRLSPSIAHQKAAPNSPGGLLVSRRYIIRRAQNKSTPSAGMLFICRPFSRVMPFLKGPYALSLCKSTKNSRICKIFSHFLRNVPTRSHSASGLQL